jgi:hypothetical protein
MPRLTEFRFTGHELANHMVVDAPAFNLTQSDFEAGPALLVPPFVLQT